MFCFHRRGIIIALAGDYCGAFSSHHSSDSDYAVLEEDPMPEELKCESPMCGNVVFLEPIIRSDHLQRRSRLCWDTIWGYESVILDSLVIINNNGNVFTDFEVASVACKFNSCFPTAKGQSKTENCEGRIQAEHVHVALSLLGSSSLSRSNSLIFHIFLEAYKV